MVGPSIPFQRHHFHGQGFEDLYVFEHFFSNCTRPPYHRAGTFVEMGAADGVKISNTLFFEQFLGWKGLLVEPSSNFANVKRHRENGHRNTLLREAVCAEAGHVTWSEPQNKDVSGVLEHLSSHNLQHYHAHGAQRTKIACRPLGEMLLAAGIDSIDFFSLDTEGGELGVLQTMNWSVPIGVLCVELDGQNVAKDQAVRNLLLSKGYRQHGQRMGFRKWNEIWRPAASNQRDFRATTAFVKNLEVR